MFLVFKKKKARPLPKEEEFARGSAPTRLAGGKGQSLK
jgi:hypothetical protein